MSFLPRLFRRDKPPSATPAEAAGEAGGGAAAPPAAPPAPPALPEAPAEQSAPQRNMSVSAESDQAMANEEAGILVSEAQIAVHWREEEYYQPSPKFIGQANASDPSIYERFREENFPECFKEYADLLTWDQYWHTTLDTSNPPFWKWFVGGRLNASYNCVDRHLATNRNKTALLWVPELETEAPQAVTYQELYVSVNEVAALLRDCGGDRAGERR